MYDVHLGLIGKRVVDFLLVIIELLLLNVTAEALRAKIDLKSAFRFIAVTLTQNFRQKRTFPANNFCTDS